MFHFVCLIEIHIYIVFNFDKITLKILSEDYSVNLTNIAMSKIFEMTPQGVGKWKKEKRPIISLLEKYFTKEDIEEFLEYGTIEKLEFANIQNYSVQAAEFVNVLNAVKQFVEFYSKEEYQNLYKKYGQNEPDEFLGYIPNDEENDSYLPSSETLDDYYQHLYSDLIKNSEGLVYLALVFSKGKFESCEDFTVDSVSQQIINYYDIFVLEQGLEKRKIKSSSLGVFITAFREKYPKYANYQEVLFSLHETNFISLVRQCLRFQPQYADLALWFCIQFNLYKYNSPLDIKDIYRRVIDVIDYDPEIGTSRFVIDLEALKKEIAKIEKS